MGQPFGLDVKDKNFYQLFFGKVFLNTFVSFTSSRKFYTYSSEKIKINF